MWAVELPGLREDRQQQPRGAVAHAAALVTASDRSGECATSAGRARRSTRGAPRAATEPPAPIAVLASYGTPVCRSWTGGRAPARACRTVTGHTPAGRRLMPSATHERSAVAPSHYR